MDQQGTLVSGVATAESRSGAIAALAERGVFVTDMQQEGGKAESKPLLSWSFRRQRISLREKGPLLRQMWTALKAGLPLLSALRVVEEQADTTAMRELVGDLARRVQAGEPLSSAMEAHGREFSRLEVSMVRVGETAGLLDEVMGYLSEFADRDVEIRQKLRTAMMYPAFVMGLVAVSIVIVMAFILPRILGSITENVATLPAPTAALVWMTSAVRSYGWLMVLAIAAGVWAFRAYISQPAGRLAFDKFKLRIPLLGTALRRIAVARFARTLGTLSRSGIQILEALRVLRDTLGNEALAQELDRVAAGITQGQSIAEPLRHTGQFPPLLIQVIAMGERTGRLDELLLQTADAYEKETSAAIAQVMAILPAIFIMLMALVVGFILAGIMLPIVSMGM